MTTDLTPAIEAVAAAINVPVLLPSQVKILATVAVRALGLEQIGWMGQDVFANDPKPPYFTTDIGEPDEILYPVYRLRALEKP